MSVLPDSARNMFGRALPRALVSIPRREFTQRGNPATDPDEQQLVDAIHRELVVEGVAEEVLHETRRYPQRDWSTAKQKRGGFDLALCLPNQLEGPVVAETKLWDIEHTLFDLAKVCTALRGAATDAFLIVWAPGVRWRRCALSEIYPTRAGERFEDSFDNLIRRHSKAWSHDIRPNTPMPLRVPKRVATEAIIDEIESPAYPGTWLRAVQVEILSDDSVELEEGHLVGRG